ncbi:MAG: extracellular solute-binding protein [Gammaproteobacteria bacterium]|nr:extracellular solute-binding protein [Gammaproteobacteria bacterium]
MAQNDHSSISKPHSHKTVAQKDKILNIVGWDVYADPKNRNKTIGYKAFEQKSGYIVNFIPLNNLDDIISYAESHHDIDLLIISNEGIEMLLNMNLVKPLSTSLISHYQDLHHNLKYTKWGHFNGNVYAVPWAWGPTGLLYDQDKIKEPTSWNIFWDPKFRYQSSIWDDVSMIWITALSLGYKNVYNLTQNQLEQIKIKLFQLNDLMYDYYGGEQEVFDLLLSGKIIITNSWFDPSGRLKNHHKNFKMVIPKEGAVGMFDSYILSQNSSKEAIAHQFIDHQISPVTQLLMSQITGLSPANIETLSLMTQDEIKGLHLDEQDYFSKMILWDIMPRKHLYDQLLKDVQQDFSRKQQKR